MLALWWAGGHELVYARYLGCFSAATLCFGGQVDASYMASEILAGRLGIDVLPLIRAQALLGRIVRYRSVMVFVPNWTRLCLVASACAAVLGGKL